MEEIGLEEAGAPPRHMPADPPLLDLAEVLGQGRAVSLLLNAMETGRLHHAYLFSGPMGVGKRTTAEAFAAMLLDPTLERDLTGGLAAEPESRVRRLVGDRSHPDLHLVNKELSALSREPSVRGGKQRSIPIDVVREFVIEPAFRAAAMSHAEGMKPRASKVFIIDEAEMLASGQDASQNALLKTLEEPPAGTVIVLSCNNEHRLLPTIRSRCQRVPFVPLDDGAMEMWLERSELELGSHEREWVSRFADGSPGRAQVAAETGLFEWARALTPMLEGMEAGRFAPELGETMTKLTEEWAKAWVSRNPSASKEAANHAAYGHLLNVLAEYYRPKLRTADAERAVGAIERLRDAERFASANVSAKLVFGDLAAQLAAV